MKCFCEHCDRFVNTSGDEAMRRMHTAEIKGREVTAEEKYLICPICGESVYTNELVNYNIHMMHNAYRLSVGSITAEEIRDILDAYDIGAEPLSRLLGWGPNTIERQMKHTIPDKEHARRLRELNDPRKMLELLDQNGGSISKVAYKKAREAAESMQIILRIDNKQMREERGSGSVSFVQLPFDKIRTFGVKKSIDDLFNNLSKGLKIVDTNNPEKQKSYSMFCTGGYQ